MFTARTSAHLWRRVVPNVRFASSTTEDKFKVVIVGGGWSLSDNLFKGYII